MPRCDIILPIRLLREQHINIKLFRSTYDQKHAEQVPESQCNTKQYKPYSNHVVGWYKCKANVF